MPQRPFVLLTALADGPRGLTSSASRQLLAMEARVPAVSQLDGDFLSRGVSEGGGEEGGGEEEGERGKKRAWE